ncbi:MAG: DMT family transporter [Alphaproteobacteria bacterium]|nr:DMT family transporter [Alphaproteobacteria bacterium]MBU0805684.1 DMT family transporter [Alphaproteobacteria bacterium]MBU0873630.1 DMT family transporter [Alphaproteobacteria bacterium]MBU1401142.1 DMT family transporter [Alphaproteobacteria bacterium]MBU1592441.1 DMT family transporter [Alphaproteobacteria bacterium]
MRADRPLLGIMLMIGFCAMAPVADAMAKLLGGRVPLSEMLLVRFAAQGLLLLPVIWLTGRRLSLTRGAFKLTVLRSLLHIIGLGAMFTALRFLPLADAVAMAFVMPFIMLLLGWLVLSEEVGWHRLLACTVGFAGTLLVVQPSFAAVGAPALLPLLVAFVFALFMLVSRKLARENDPIVLQALSGMVSTLILAPIALLFAHARLPFFEVMLPGTEEWALLLGVGVLGTLGHLLMTWALRFAPAATLAPIQYLEIPLATAVGWLVFRDLPDGIAALGIVVIMCAGLYILLVERAIPRPAAASPQSAE